MSFSYIKSAIEAILKIHTYILKKFGKKLADLDEYNDQEIELTLNDEYLKCIKEKNNNAVFSWSKTMKLEYEKYFEIEGNVRRYFVCEKQFLLIKRNQSKN